MPAISKDSLSSKTKTVHLAISSKRLAFMTLENMDQADFADYALCENETIVRSNAVEGMTKSSVENVGWIDRYAIEPTARA